MLAYTLAKTLPYQAVIERNSDKADAYGARGTPVWRPYLTVPCALWWTKPSGARGSQRTYVSSARTVSASLGTLAIPLDVDVTQEDRIVNVLGRAPGTRDWDIVVTGEMEIQGVVAWSTHIELAVTRAAIGV